MATTEKSITKKYMQIIHEFVNLKPHFLNIIYMSKRNLMNNTKQLKPGIHLNFMYLYWEAWKFTYTIDK